MHKIDNDELMIFFLKLLRFVEDRSRKFFPLFLAKFFIRAFINKRFFDLHQKRE